MIPEYTFDIDRDGRQDIIVFKDNGDEMIYVSLRFLFTSTMTGVAAAVAYMHYII